MEMFSTGIFKQLKNLEEDKNIEYLDDAIEQFMDSLDSVEKDNKTYDFMQFLHGYCDIFIISLFHFAKNNNLNYNIYRLKDNFGTIHCFSIVEKNNVKYFIDVRGITTSIDDFFSEFEDFFCYKSYFNGDETSAIICCYDNLNDYLEDSKIDEFELFDEILSQSKHLINAFNDYYLLEV